MNKISVALCTYNGAKYISEQLESIAAQTVLPDEIVIIDDQSTDATAEIIEKFAAQNSIKIRFYANPKNLGSTKNFERAISLCDGDIIFLCDQDDVWLKDKIEKTVAAFDSEKVGFVFTDAELVDENLKPLNVNLWKFTFFAGDKEKFRAGKFLELLLERNIVTGATMAFRAKFRASLTPIPTDLPNTIHDAWISLVIAAQAEARFLDSPTIKYRQHSNQQCGVDYRGRSRAPDVKNAYQNAINSLRREADSMPLFSTKLLALPVFQPHRRTVETALKARYQFLRRRIEHFEARKNLPVARIARVAPIFRELLTKRYHQVSNGFVSAIKDLMEN